MKGKVQFLEAQGQLNRQISSALSKFRAKVTEQIQEQQNSVDHNKYDPKKQGTEKVFHFRQSLLSIKFQIPDYKTLYNMMAASLTVLMFSLFYESYIAKGQIIDVIQLRHFFRGWKSVFVDWWILATIHYTIIGIVFIAIKTNKLFWIPLYIIHQIILYGFALKAARDQNLGFGCVFIILCEATRMLMKSHSYFRTKLLYLKDNQYKKWVGTSKDAKVNKEFKMLHIELFDFFGEIKRFSYFFVCPTLIYRDSYTLTPVRSLSKMIFHFVNFMACIYYAFILYLKTCKDTISALEKELNFDTFIATVIKLMLPSVLFLILGFFGFLHSWLNLWSEITRFPDRAFYSDWWNSYQFGSYYRKWNIVVHDWLYHYIYLDLQRFFESFRKNKFLPQIATFIISAVIHEIIVCFAIGFFYPILFILFTGPGIILIQNQKRMKSIAVNFLFWLEMYIGSALLFSCYLVESFARETISDEIIEKDFPNISFLIPRTLYLGQGSIMQ